MAFAANKSLHKALQEEKPLQVVGTINAYTALMAEHVGYRALYLSGAGVANASYGLPDLGITSLDNVLTDAQRITDATSLPLLVDIDTGWGSTLTIARATKRLINAGAAGLHIEDQVAAKKCGHLAGKKVVTQKLMIDRIKAACDANSKSDFVIMARTDAFAAEGLAGVIERAQAYIEAGADMLFPEALTTLEDYQTLVQAINVPVLANITEFGKTPLLTREELSMVGVSMILYPLSAFRAMNKAALTVYQTIRQTGTQRTMLNSMQTREELYDFLHYSEYETKLNEPND